MMTVAELVARLRADTSNFDQGMNRAERRLDSFTGKTSRSMSVFSGMGRAFDQTVSGMAVAATGLATSLIAVGTSYNTLLQKTNAAFETILGSAKRADKMVGDLTVFARESPFPRQVFIEATQQLLGFGLAAEKVIPSFEAIQDAVAATGGGAGEIRQFTDIFAQIKSLGRANTDVLMRFSYAGIDAFKLLADQAGVSVAEMRKQVTEGMIGADTAIEMLTSGLTDKFDGAAAGVKETWLGTKDRIAGAWRDIGSALVAPFIDPNGGGALVEIGNKLGDLLRLVANDYAPAAGKAIKGFVDEWRPMIEDFDAKDFMESAIDGFQRFHDIAGDLIPVLAAVSAGFLSNGLSMLPFVGQLFPAIGLTGKLALGLGALVLSSEESRNALMGAGDAIKAGLADLLPKILPQIQSMIDGLTSLVPPLVEIAASVVEAGWPLFAAGMQVAISVAQGLIAVLQPVAQVLADHPGLVKGIVIAWAGFKIAALASSLGNLTMRLHAMAAGQAAVTRATTASLGVQGGAAGMAAINANMANFGSLAGAATAGVGRLRGALTTLGKVAGPMLVVAALMEIVTWTQKADDAAQAFFQETLGDIDTSSVDGMERSLAAIQSRIAEINDAEELKAPEETSGLGKAISWLAGKVGIDTQRLDPRDGRDEAMEQHLAEQRRLQQSLAYTSAMTERTSRAWGVFSAAITKVINPMARFNSVAAQGLLAIGALGDGILEAADASTAAMQGMIDPMGIWGSMTPASEIKKDLADMPALYRDMENAQRSAADAARGVADAQERVNEVLAKQFDATESATSSIQNYLSAQRAAIDPVFAMIRAGVEAEKVAADVARGITDSSGNITMTPGADLLQRAEANMGLDSAAINLAAQIQTGRTSFEGVARQVEGWVARGTLEAQQASDLLAKVQEAINSGQSLGGATASRVISEGVAADRAAFERQQARELADARRALEDAVRGAQDAQRGVQEAAAAINNVDLNGFAKNVSGASGEVVQSLSGMMDAMEGQIADMRQWQTDIRTIAERGGVELAQEVMKWGPAAAPLVAELANATAPEFDRFVTLTQEKMALSTLALETELASMAYLATEEGAKIAQALIDEMGIGPGEIGQVMEVAKDDFKTTMQVLAEIAENGGTMTVGALMQAMKDEYGLKHSETFAIVNDIVSQFEWANGRINSLVWNMPPNMAPELGLAPTATMPTMPAGGGMGGMSKADAEALWIWNATIAENKKKEQDLAAWYANAGGAPKVSTSKPTGVFRGYADGGIRMPKIAHGIQYAEPETHGEAYIPLALSKRARSKAILEQVSGMFGMNGEEEYAASSGRAGAGGNVHNEFTAVVNNYGPDSGMDKGVRELEKMAYRSGWGD